MNCHFISFASAFMELSDSCLICRVLSLFEIILLQQLHIMCVSQSIAVFDLVSGIFFCHILVAVILVLSKNVHLFPDAFLVSCLA